MTIDETIAHVLKLSDSATVGPWEVDALGDWIWRMEHHEGQTLLVDHICDMRGVGGNLAIDDNAALIASYRSLCPKLARALRTAVETLRKLEKSLESPEWDIALGALAEIQKEFES